MSWPLVKIGDFCITGSGGTPSRSIAEYYQGDIPWIKSGDLRENIVTKATEFISDNALRKSSAKMVAKGSILLAMYGATVGRMALLGIDAATNQAVCNITPDTERAFTKYVYYALLSKVPEFLKNAVGGAQPNISQGIIRDTLIPLPSLEEQKRIAAILDKADVIRRKRQQAIKLADDFLSAEFWARFGDPKNSPYGSKSLKEVTLKITDGAHFTPTYANAGVPFLRVTDINKENIDWTRVKYIPKSEHQELIKRCNPEAGDVLYSKNGTIGVPKLIDWDFEFSIFVSLCLIKPDPKYLRGKYLFSFLKTPFALKQAVSKSKSATVTNLHLVEIKEIKMPVPSLEIQDEWIEFADKFNAVRARLVASLRKAESMFNSISQKAFSGRL